MQTFTDQKLIQKFFELNMLSRFLGDKGFNNFSRNHTEYNVFHGQGRLLLVLSEMGELSQKDLSSSLGMTPQSTAEFISKLLKKKLITKNRSKKDGRVFMINLTDDGREEVKKMSSYKPSGLNYLSDIEKEQLLYLMSKIVEGMQIDFDENETNPGIIATVQHKIAEHIIHEHIPKNK